MYIGIVKAVAANNLSLQLGAAESQTVLSRTAYVGAVKPRLGTAIFGSVDIWHSDIRLEVESLFLACLYYGG